MSDDHNRLVEALRQLAPSVKISVDPAWSRPPPLRVIDCVLSLMRHYDRFVVPRLNAFERKFPHIMTVKALDAEIKRYASSGEFMTRALKYNHEARAETLAHVVSWLAQTCGNDDKDVEIINLERWASDASYASYRATNRIQGFGLAGFQYLRMLFGADTTKPDLRVRQWVEGAIGRRVSDIEALTLLERATPEAGLKLRDVDTTVWEMLARHADSPTMGSEPLALEKLCRAWEQASDEDRRAFLKFIEVDVGAVGS